MGHSVHTPLANPYPRKQLAQMAAPLPVHAAPRAGVPLVHVQCVGATEGDADGLALGAGEGTYDGLTDGNADGALVHSVLSAFCCSPSEHAIGHAPPVPALPAGHHSQAVRSAVGCCPSPHATPHAPPVPTRGGGHGTQFVLTSFGCLPSGHRVQLVMTPAPADVSSKVE